MEPGHRRLATVPMVLLASCGIAVFAAAPPSADAKVPPAGTESVQPIVAAKTGGRIEIAKALVDVGDVARGQLATAVFEIRNSGQEVLKILEARPG